MDPDTIETRHLDPNQRHALGHATLAARKVAHRHGATPEEARTHAHMIATHIARCADALAEKVSGRLTAFGQLLAAQSNVPGPRRAEWDRKAIEKIAKSARDSHAPWGSARYRWRQSAEYALELLKPQGWLRRAPEQVESFRRQSLWSETASIPTPALNDAGRLAIGVAALAAWESARHHGDTPEQAREIAREVADHVARSAVDEPPLAAEPLSGERPIPDDIWAKVRPPKPRDE